MVYANAGPTGSNPMTGIIGYLLGLKGPSGFGSGSTAEEVVSRWDGRGKVVVITGASVGLGLESAVRLAGRGATVVLAARDRERCRRACDAVRAAHPGARLHGLRLDLADLDSVREFAEEVRRLPEVVGDGGGVAAGASSSSSALGGGGVTATVAARGGGAGAGASKSGGSDSSGGGGGSGGIGNGSAGAGAGAGGGGVYCLMCNAGVMALPRRAAYPLVAAADAASPEEQPDLQWRTNHAGHHLLARLLEPELRRAGEHARRNSGDGSGDCARAVFLSSVAHFTTYLAKDGGPVRLSPFGGPSQYDPWLAYGQSKLCNLLCAREFATRWAADGAPVVSVACHPGVIVATDLFRHMPLCSWAPVRAALSLLWKPFLKSIAQGAATQCYLATAKIAPAGSRAGVTNASYYADVNVSPSSRAAADDALGRRLWDVTEGYVGGGGACV